MHLCTYRLVYFFHKRSKKFVFSIMYYFFSLFQEEASNFSRWSLHALEMRVFIPGYCDVFFI
jgi:hypothetical protein